MASMFSDRAVRMTMRHGIRRCFHASSARHSSPFFALAKLSNSRETQHLNKLSKLSRVEHSPNLQLIQSSEVDPFGSRKPSVPKIVSDTKRSAVATPPSTESLSDAEIRVEVKESEKDLLSIGRAILAEKNEQIQDLRQALEEEMDRSYKREASYARARSENKERISRLHQDVTSARVWKWCLIVMGGSYAAWTYLSESLKERNAMSAITRQSSSVLDSTPINSAVALPQTFSKSSSLSLDPVIASQSTKVVPASATTASASTISPSPALISSSSSTKQSGWPSVFWKS